MTGTCDIYCTECARVCEHTVTDVRAVDGLNFFRTTCARCSFSVTWAGESEDVLNVLVLVAPQWERAGVS